MFLRKQKEVETKPYSNRAHRGIPSDLCECNFSNDREEASESMGPCGKRKLGCLAAQGRQ